MDFPSKDPAPRQKPSSPPPPPPRPSPADPMRPRKLYKIGEVMRYSRLSRQTLHNYTMMGLISASERTDSGHRLYDESVFRLLERIELLKRHRTLSEVKELIARDQPEGQKTQP